MTEAGSWVRWVDKWIGDVGGWIGAVGGCMGWWQAGCLAGWLGECVIGRVSGGVAGWLAASLEQPRSNGPMPPAPIATSKAIEFIFKQFEKKHAQRNAPPNVIPPIVLEKNRTTKCEAFPRTTNGRKKKNEALNEND